MRCGKPSDDYNDRREETGAEGDGKELAELRLHDRPHGADPDDKDHQHMGYEEGHTCVLDVLVLDAAVEHMQAAYARSMAQLQHGCRLSVAESLPPKGYGVNTALELLVRSCTGLALSCRIGRARFSLSCHVCTAVRRFGPVLAKGYTVLSMGITRAKTLVQ